MTKTYNDWLKEQPPCTPSEVPPESTEQKLKRKEEYKISALKAQEEHLIYLNINLEKDPLNQKHWQQMIKLCEKAISSLSTQ